MNYEQQSDFDKWRKDVDTVLADFKAELIKVLEPLLSPVVNFINRFFSKHPRLLKVLVVLDKIFYGGK